MQILKRNGVYQDFDPIKIKRRIEILDGRSPFSMDNIDVDTLVEKTAEGAVDGMKTSDLDTFLMENAAMKVAMHPDYSYLASAIAVSNLHIRVNSRSFLEKTELMDSIGILNERYVHYVRQNHEKIESLIDYMRDYEIDLFGFKTLERAYLIKDKDGEIIESPQDMYMRVAITIRMGSLDEVRQVYDSIGRKYIHATPTLFNAGTVRQQLASCFLLDMKADSVDGIYDTLSQCAKISQTAGGIGLAISKIRSKGSYIKGTNGHSNGLVPLAKVYNETARHIDQGGGKRKGAFAMYLEPWHPDVMDFLELKKNHGKEEMRARDLFYAMWIPDLFMERVQEAGKWSLFCPNECPGLQEAYGDGFVQLYEKYESEGKAKETIDAQSLWFKILESQMETGTPYMLYKDACNQKSNQKNLGTIKSSNLCTEILEYTSPDEVAVCNLASLSLPYFLEGKEYDFKGLEEAAYEVTVNINRVIDVSYYPVPEAKRSNMRHRPIGIGVQGLADTYARLGLAFDSEEAAWYNKEIFAAIYHGSVRASIDLAEKHGPYESYEGSPASQGMLQFDLWGKKPSDSWDWESLKARLSEHGMRNSLLLAPMPTASCQIVDTEVVTNDGTKSYRHILEENGFDVDDIELSDNPRWLTLPNSVEILTKDNEFVSTDQIYYNGHKEVISLEMEDGTVFEATENHKFLVNREGKETWVRVDEIEEGDNIVNLEVGTMKVNGMSKSGVKPTWDLHVPKVHNYVTKNGCVSHNTSQILGNNECFEPFTWNVFVRRVLSGEFIITNKHLVKDLEELGIWNEEMKNMIIASKGSIQGIEHIPAEIRERYKTCYEISQKAIIDQAADRGIYVCQSQSMNLFMADHNMSKMTSMHFYAWKKGLKTGMYYLRSKPAVDAIQFTVDKKANTTPMTAEQVACSLENPDSCEMCGS